MVSATDGSLSQEVADLYVNEDLVEDFDVKSIPDRIGMDRDFFSSNLTFNYLSSADLCSFGSLLPSLLEEVLLSFKSSEVSSCFHLDLC